MPLQEFYCKICKKKIKYVPEKVKIKSKEITQSNLLGGLITYRVGHKVSKTLKHINVVVYDSNGEYRGHRDAYIEQITVGQEQEWQDFYSSFPLEWRKYLSIASEETKRNLLDFFTKIPTLLDIWRENCLSFLKSFPDNDYFAWITGLMCESSSYQEKFWEIVSISGPLTKLLALYSLAEQSLDDVTLNKLEKKREEPYPALVKITNNVKLAQLYSQTSRYADFERIYQEAKKEWLKIDDLWIKNQYYIVLSLFSEIKRQQGMYEEAYSSAKESYQYQKLSGNRVAILISGKIYIDVLQTMGKIIEAETIIEDLKETAKSLNYDRELIELQNSNAIILLQKGSYKRAHEVLKECQRNLIHVNDVLFEADILVNLAKTHLGLRSWTKAENAAKSALMLGVLVPPQNIPALTTILRIAQGTHSEDLLDYIETYIKDGALKQKNTVKSSTPILKLFLAELNATKFNIANNLSKAIKEFNKAANLASKIYLLDRAAVIHQFLAELYFKQYMNSSPKDWNFWRKSYEQLDLAGSAAKECNYLVGQSSALLLKIYLLIEVGFNKRAEKVKTQVIKIAEELNDQKLLVELKNVETYSSKDKKATSNAFERLKILNEVISKETSSSIVKGIYVLFIQIQGHNYDKTFISPYVFRSSNSSIQESRSYWEGYIASIRATTQLWKQKIEKEDYNILKDEITGTSIVIEQNKSMRLIAISEGESYSLRVNLRQLSAKIELYLQNNEQLSSKFEDYLLEKFKQQGFGYLQLKTTFKKE